MQLSQGPMHLYDAFTLYSLSLLYNRCDKTAYLPDSYY